MKRFAALLICLVMVACNQPTPTPPGPVGPVPQPTGEIHAQLLQLHNDQRKINGKAPLVENPLLLQAAQNHANHMASVGLMGHILIGDGTPAGRVNATGYKWSSTGENVAWNYQGTVKVMSGWMASPGHRANILGNFKDFGGAVAYGKKNDPYWCTVFGTSSNQMVIQDSQGTTHVDGPQFKSGEGYLVKPYSSEEN